MDLILSLVISIKQCFNCGHALLSVTVVIFPQMWSLSLCLSKMICHTLHKTDYRDEKHSKCIITELSDYFFAEFNNSDTDGWPACQGRGLSFVSINSCVWLKGGLEQKYDVLEIQYNPIAN